MDVWVKSVYIPLLVGVVATFLSGILLALWKRIMEWCCHPRPEPSPGPAPGIVESGDQAQAQAGAVRDVEMGTINGGETAAGHLSGDVGANGSIPRHDDGGLRGRNEDIGEDMADGLEIHEPGLLRQSDSA